MTNFSRKHIDVANALSNRSNTVADQVYNLGRDYAGISTHKPNLRRSNKNDIPKIVKEIKEFYEGIHNDKTEFELIMETSDLINSLRELSLEDKLIVAQKVKLPNIYPSVFGGDWYLVLIPNREDPRYGSIRYRRDCYIPSIKTK